MKKVTDDTTRDQMIINNLRSMDKYNDRFLSLYNLSERIKREIGD